MLRLLIVCLIAFINPALGADTELCRNGIFPRQETIFGLAKVIGAPPAYLQSDIPPCPDDSAACRGRAYVLPRDTVITGVASGGYVCAFFAGPGGGSAGFVRRDEITPQSMQETPPLVAWLGTWRDGDNRIALRRDGAKLTADGEAYWPSAHPSAKDRPGGRNLGDMGGTAAPTGNTVVFAGDTPDECRVVLTLLPPFLLAADNMNCGGMNVSFTGVYRKR
jgi:hypothetical protein